MESQSRRNLLLNFLWMSSQAADLQDSLGFWISPTHENEAQPSQASGNTLNDNNSLRQQPQLVKSAFFNNLRQQSKEAMTEGPTCRNNLARPTFAVGPRSVPAYRGLHAKAQPSAWIQRLRRLVWLVCEGSFLVTSAPQQAPPHRRLTQKQQSLRKFSLRIMFSTHVQGNKSQFRQASACAASEANLGSCLQMLFPATTSYILRMPFRTRRNSQMMSLRQFWGFPLEFFLELKLELKAFRSQSMPSEIRDFLWNFFFEVEAFRNSMEFFSEF